MKTTLAMNRNLDSSELPTEWAGTKGARLPANLFSSEVASSERRAVRAVVSSSSTDPKSAEALEDEGHPRLAGSVRIQVSGNGFHEAWLRRECSDAGANIFSERRQRVCDFGDELCASVDNRNQILQIVTPLIVAAPAPVEGFERRSDEARANPPRMRKASSGAKGANERADESSLLSTAAQEASGQHEDRLQQLENAIHRDPE